ncbi:MAG: MBL fold metallo-hydrolase [Acutalibacter sp.]|nr:MBL fold metallo-hydrolase [Acutalibacter sp.]
MADVTNRAFYLKKEQKQLKRDKITLGILVCVVVALCALPPVQTFWKAVCFQGRFSDWTGQKLPLEIHVLDVGKADAILIKSDGYAALLDSGHFLAGYQTTDYLFRHGVESLDYVILSHPDSDHMDGMANVVSEIETGMFLRAELQPEASASFSQLDEILREQNVPQRVLRQGEQFTLGQAEFTVLGPVREYADTNNSSLVLRMDCGGFSALFCGDIEKEAEADLVLSGQDLSVDLLKVAHHGSSTSSTEEFIRQVAPRCAVVSTGYDRNKLPREEPLACIEAAGARIYRTDTDGDIVFSFDGECVTITTEK